jgi:hypothetical protein
MCYNCGCHIPDDPMGSDDNITNKTFEQIAKKEGKTVHDIQMAVYNMLEHDEITDPNVIQMFEAASRAWGQPIDDAKKYTKELLKNVLKIKD